MIAKSQTKIHPTQLFESVKFSRRSKFSKIFYLIVFICRWVSALVYLISITDKFQTTKVRESHNPWIFTHGFINIVPSFKKQNLQFMLQYNKPSYFYIFAPSPIIFYAKPSCQKIIEYKFAKKNASNSFYFCAWIKFNASYAQGFNFLKIF